MWSEGTIGIPANEERVICHYWCKHFEEGSEFGIDGGRISKLTIKVDGKVTCNYDRGWDVEPEDEVTKRAFEILMEEYN